MQGDSRDAKTLHKFLRSAADKKISKNFLVSKHVDLDPRALKKTTFHWARFELANLRLLHEASSTELLKQLWEEGPNS